MSGSWLVGPLLAELCCEGRQTKPIRVRAASQCCSTFVLAMLAPWCHCRSEIKSRSCAG
jgi:hypothetical protein